MAVIDKSTNSIVDLTSVATEFLRQSMSEFDVRLGDVAKLAYVKTSNRQQIRFPVNSVISSGMKEWAGERHNSSVLKQSMTVTTKRYDDGLDIDETDLADGGVADPQMLANDLWNLSSVFPGKLLATLLNGGSSATGFDGVNFFGTTHPIAAGITGTNLGTSSPLSQANLEAGQTKFRQWPRADGTPRGLPANTLILPPSLAELGNTLVATNQLLVTNSTTGITTLGSKPVQSISQVIVLDQLEQASISGSATTWYLADLSQIRKPLLMGITDINAASDSVGMADAMTAIRNLFKLGTLGFDSEFYKLNKKIKFYIDAWLGATYGDPSLIYRFNA